MVVSLLSFYSITMFSLTRSSFYVNLSVSRAAFLILVLLYHAPEQIKHAPTAPLELLLVLDIPGTIFIIAALLCFFLALQWGGETKSWNSADVIDTLTGWICLAIIFVII
jgi:hypothetical protein